MEPARNPDGAAAQLHKNSNCSHSGVSSALKLLTALFIGGASSCTALLSCHKVDGGSDTSDT